MPSPIMIISGTNRANSNALRIARIIHGHYQTAKIATELFSLEELPREVFDPSSYAKKPPAMVAIQQRVLEAQGLHVITPEYNGSFPGVLKYFIDMLKFPDSFDRKPVAFVGEANGVWGGLRSVEQLQMIFGYRNAHSYPDRVFIPGVNNKFDADGNFTDTAINERLKKQAIGFECFVHSICSIASQPPPV
jgi:chromate reductase, NAD(P)H dehydrogenase (quinone)